MMVMLLLAGFLLPSGMHAAQFLDYCMMEMPAHHEMTDHAHTPCDSSGKDASTETDSFDDCDNTVICACSIDETPFNRENGLISSPGSAITLPETGFDHTLFSANEPIRNELRFGLNHHSPPLYLLYDTFLN